MDSKLISQFGPTAFTVVPLAAVMLWAGSTEMADGVQAALYAIVAATGLAMTLVPRPEHDWDEKLDFAIRGATVFAAWYSAHHWILSEDAGNATKYAVAAWATIVAVFVWWQVHKQQTEDSTPVNTVDEAD